MPDYQVVIKPSAAKEFDKLPVNVAVRVAAKIESLARTPRPPGVKKLEGEPTRWRIRVSDWRVIFEILTPHPGSIVGDADDLVHVDWSQEWKPDLP